MNFKNSLTKAFIFFSFCLGLDIQAMTLSQAVQHAVQTNPNVLRALKECMASKEQWRGSYGNYFPSLDASAGYGVEKSDNATTRARDSKNETLVRSELGLQARQMLFDGLETANNVRRTRARADAFAWVVVAEANDVALRVAEAYLNVLRQQQLVQNARENLQTHQRTAEMITQRSASGVSRETDAVQANGRLAQAQANLKTEEGYLKDAEIAFFRATGLDVRHFRQPLIPERVLPPSQTQAINIALNNHPRLRSANADIVERLAQYKHTHSNFYPHLYAEFGLHKNHNIDGVRGRNDDYSAMLRANWNLFRGGADLARKRETAYLAQEAAEIRNRTFRQLMENTSLVWVAYRNNRRLLGDLHKHTQAALETIDAYSKQFQLGQRTLLDLLNSQNEYFDAKRIYINAQYDCMVSKLRLLNNTGQLLGFFNVDMNRLGPGYKHLNHLLKLPTYRPKASQWGGDAPASQQTSKARPTIKVSPSDGKNTGEYAIQLLATSQEASLKAFIQANEFGDVPLSYHRTTRDGKDWFELLYGRYATLKEARAAVQTLSPAFKCYAPWVRSIAGLEQLHWVNH